MENDPRDKSEYSGYDDQSEESAPAATPESLEHAAAVGEEGEEATGAARMRVLRARIEEERRKMLEERRRTRRGGERGEDEDGEDEEEDVLAGLDEDEVKRLRRQSAAYDAFVRRSDRAFTAEEVRARLAAVDEVLDNSEENEEILATLDQFGRDWSEDSADAIPDLSPGRAKPLAVALGTTGCLVAFVALIFGFLGGLMDKTEAAVIFGLGAFMMTVSVFLLVVYIFCADQRRDEYAGLDNDAESRWVM